MDRYGPWQDIKSYTSVIVTVDTSSSEVIASPCTIYWGTGENDNPPRAVGDGITENDLIDVVATDLYPQMQGLETRTVQFDARTRWFRIKSTVLTEGSNMHISTQYKVAPTEIQIRDNRTSNIGSGGIVKVNNKALQIALTDSSSRLLTTTDDNRNTTYALYTHLADASGGSLDTSAHTLAVFMRDASNVSIGSTGTPSDVTINDVSYYGANSVKAVMSDLRGIEQASTDVVQGSAFGGRALYYSLADKNGIQYRTTKNDIDVSNAMYVHLSDQNGKSINKLTNQLHVYFVDELRQIVTPFDIAVEASMSTTADISNHSLHLRHLGIANELPITIWLKVYDMSTGANTNPIVFTTYTEDLVYNIPVAGNDYRDIHMSDGVPFTKGLHFRISPDYAYDNSYFFLGPDSGRVYVHGACSKLSVNNS